MPVFELVDSILDDLFELNGSPIAYRRDGVTMAENVLAKIGSTLFRTEDRNGITIRVEQRDFLIRVADVNGLDEPQKGDEIIWDNKTYMVSAPNGEPCWRWHTRQTHTQMRIHAKYIGDYDPNEDQKQDLDQEPDQNQDDDET